MTPDLICLAIAPLVSFVISGLKRIPFVKRFPKSAAFFVSALVGGWISQHGTPTGIDYNAILQCVLTQWAGAIATHEAVTNQVQKVVAFGGDGSE